MARNKNIKRKATPLIKNKSNSEVNRKEVDSSESDEEVSDMLF